jgi:hypothetical protein
VTAYVDSSCLIAILLGEPQAARITRRLASHEVLLSSNLLEAELRSVMSRDSISSEPAGLLAGISWAYPDRPLTSEFGEVLSAGYVRGADLWHLAVALWLDPRREIEFLTLDDRQKTVARGLKFAT